MKTKSDQKIHQSRLEQGITIRRTRSHRAIVDPPPSRRTIRAAPYGRNQPSMQAERLPIAWLVQAVSRADALPVAQAIRASSGARFGAAILLPMSAFRRWVHRIEGLKDVVPMLHRLKAHGLIGFTVIHGAFQITPRRG